MAYNAASGHERWNKDGIVRTDKDSFVVLDRDELARVAAE